MFENTAILYVTKLLPQFVYPLGGAIGLCLLAIMLWRRRPRLGRQLLLVAMLSLWFASTAPVANFASRTLESQFPPTRIEETPKAEVAIVLGGAVGIRVSPRVSTELVDASDRVLHAARLYRAGKVQRILVTGGNVPWMPKAEPEAQMIRELLVEWGVPETAISIATNSRNTYENALEIKDLWQQRPFSSALLVTSAMHMPRAHAVFIKAGLPVSPATTDVQAVNGYPLNALDILPDAGALAQTTTAMKEWIGLVAYKLRGYI